MASRIELRDYVLGLMTDGKQDWHEKTIFVGVDEMRFRPLTVEKLRAGTIETPWSVVLGYDGKPCGLPFNPQTNPILMPEEALAIGLEGLSGTDYTVERLGTLGDGSLWFASIFLKELQEFAPKGEHCQLNIQGCFDKTIKIRYGLSSKRIVCDNTRQMAIAEEDAAGGPLFSCKTTRFSEEKRAGIAPAIEAAAGIAKVWYHALNQMSETPCKMETARALFAGEVAGKDEQALVALTPNYKDPTTMRVNRKLTLVDDLCSLYGGSGIDVKTGSLAGVEQAFTQYYTRGGSEGTSKNPMLAIQSSEFGLNGRRKQAFFEKLTDKGEREKLVKMGRVALKEADALEFAMPSSN